MSIVALLVSARKRLKVKKHIISICKTNEEISTHIFTVKVAKDSSHNFTQKNNQNQAEKLEREKPNIEAVIH